ncbi:oxygenase MpaB family protein [Glutamicibacter uratoxydans]|uniref:oxygenase MpaB family protein n=1 Tax=Glutamicibacter uratoxydans TaxID=43667 RepID=UPI003D6FC2F5
MDAEMGTGMLASIAPEASLLLGAGRAILLQLADPRIGIAVVRHSNFVDNPMSRLHNTLAYVYALGAGNAAQRAVVIDYVNKAHKPVHAPRDDIAGTPAYSARDPKLQLWVAATLYESADVVAQQTLPRLTQVEQDELYREYVCLGQALQMPDSMWPADRAAFRNYFERSIKELQVGPEVSEAAEQLFRGHNTPWWVRIFLPLAKDLTIALLPQRVRELYGYQLTTRVRVTATVILKLVGGANRILPKFVRHAPMRWSLRRIDGGALG